MKAAFETVWNKIIDHEGETFYTPSQKKPFTYQMYDGYLIVSNAPTTQNTKANIRRGYDIIDSCTRTEFSHTIIGSSYVRALLEAFM